VKRHMSAAAAEEVETAAGVPPEMQEDPLAAHITAGGVVSTYSNAEQRQQKLERKQAIDFIVQAREHAAAVGKDLSDAEARLAKAQVTASDVRNECMALQARLEHEEAVAASRPNSHGVQLTRQHYEAAAYRLQRAETVLAREYSIAAWQRDRLDEAEKTVMKTDELGARVKEVEASAQQEMALVAEYRAARELEVAERAHQRSMAQLDEVQKTRDERETQMREALAVAERGKRAAAQRLKAATSGLAEKLHELEGYKQATRSRQQQALLELKRNSEAAFNKMKARNEIARKKREQQQVARQEEEKVILQNGGNPYEVFRRREEEDRQAREYQKLVEKQKQGEAHIAEMMVREEALFQRDMKQKAKEREYELHFQREMGRAAMEERVDKFMRKRTLGGVDIIDPTSIKESALVAVPSSFKKAGAASAPLHGSHVTVVKTSRFGLGDLNYVTTKEGDVYTTSDDVLEAVEKKYPGTTFDPTFVPPEYKVPEDGPEQFDASKLGQSATNRHGELLDELAKAEFEGMWKAGTAYGGEESRGVVDPVQLEKERQAAMQIKTTKLSVLEQKMMAKVPDKIRTNIVKPQIACGREFKGKSFLAENLTQPLSQDRIEFIDFKVGEVYKQTIRLTNVSYTFNTFKLKHLPDSIRDFFEIKYKLPGYISAGLTCDLHISFEPKIPEDINAVLPLLTETGEIGVPLICSTPKTKISVEPRVLELGAVPLCEEVTQYVTITNSGALGTGYSLMNPDVAAAATGSVPHAIALENAEEGSSADTDGATADGTADGALASTSHVLSDREQILQDIYAATPGDRRTLRFDHAGLVSGYKSVRVPITYRPCDLGDWSGTVVISFADEDTPDFTITLNAVVTQEPIFLKRSTIDFQTVLYDHVYRDSLVVHNRGKTAMKCELHLPEEAAGLRRSLEFLPPLGFPQNGGFFAFQLKFRPEPGIWDRIHSDYGDPTTGRIEFPMLVTVPDQSLPVRWVFKAQISTGELKFEPNILDFGVCSCNEAVAIDVKVSNLSALPQEVGFVRLKPEISVQPFDGFLSLLPEESTMVKVMFAPRSAVDYEFALSCKTVTGKQIRNDPTLSVEKEYQIPCRGTGVFPALELSHTVIKMAAVAEGGRTSESVVLSNVGKESKLFEFTPPEGSNLTLAPSHGRLGPGEKRRITVEHRAATTDEEPCQPADGSADDSTAVAVNDKWSVHKSVLVPCFFKQEVPGKRPREPEHLHVDINTTVIRPIVADEDGLVYRELDFGQVPLGPGKVVKFMLMNKGASEATMSCSTLDPNGPFILLSGSRPIPAGRAVQVVICFDPPEVGTFEQAVRIQTSANEYTVVCRGEGVRPKMRIEPDLTSSGTGNLHVGDVVCMKTVSKTLTLCNETDQPMTWSVRISELLRRNANGLEPFCVVPPKGELAGGAHTNVEVRFSPDHQSTGFGGLLTFDVPSQNETHQIQLTGRGWNCGTFVVGGDAAADEARPDAMAHVLPDLFDSLGSNPNKPKQLLLTLNYDTLLPEELANADGKGAEEPQGPMAVGLLTVGNAGDVAEKGANGDIAFDNLSGPKGFAMKAGKLGGMGAQESSQVAFTFQPPSVEELEQDPDPQQKEAATLLKLGVGFWQETTVMCTLKGGTPAPEGGSTSIEVKLRAYVNSV
jgi:hypothetical protein